MVDRDRSVLWWLYAGRYKHCGSPRISGAGVDFCRCRDCDRYLFQNAHPKGIRDCRLFGSYFDRAHGLGLLLNLGIRLGSWSINDMAIIGNAHRRSGNRTADGSKPKEKSLPTSTSRPSGGYKSERRIIVSGNSQPCLLSRLTVAPLFLTSRSACSSWRAVGTSRLL